jgi:hypothetical protein
MAAFVKESCRALEKEKDRLNQKQRALQERVADNKREELRLNAFKKSLDEREARIRQEGMNLILAKQAQDKVQVEESISPIRQQDELEMREKIYAERLAF